MFLKNNNTDYSKLDKNVQDRKANGGYASVEFAVADIKEYNVEATTFNGPSSNLPFEAPTGETPWGK